MEIHFKKVQIISRWRSPSDNLMKLDSQIGKHLSQVEPSWAMFCWAMLSQVEPSWAKLSQSEPSWAKVSQIEQSWAKLSQVCPSLDKKDVK